MCEKPIYLSQNYPLWCAVYPEFTWRTDKDVQKEAELDVSGVKANIDGAHLIVAWAYRGGDAPIPICPDRELIIDEIIVYGLTEEEAMEKAMYVGLRRRNEAKLEWERRLPQAWDNPLMMDDE